MKKLVLTVGILLLAAFSAFPQNFSTATFGLG